MKKFKILNTCQNLTSDYDYPRPRVFLAGCTARPGQTLNWRKDAFDIFERFGFEGTLIVPEVAEGNNWNDFEYGDICGWEHEMMDRCDVLVFWIPRNVDDGVLGLTSNAEFGRALEKYPYKVYYGRPDGSDSTRYLDWYYESKNEMLPIIRTLKNLIFQATL